MKRFTGKAALLALSCALAGGIVVGCSSAPAGDQQGKGAGSENVGGVGLNLELAEGIDVSTVHYVVTQGGVTVIEGDIPVSDPGATVSVLIGGLLPGSYSIALSATSTDGEVTCAGSADFTVAIGTTTAAHVDLECDTEETRGGVIVDGTVTGCSLNVIQSYTAAPLVTSSNGSIVLTSASANVDGAQPDFLWSTTGGTLVSPTSPNTTFNCSGAAGTHTITLTVSTEANADIPGQAPVSCNDEVSFTVSCVALSCGNGVVDTADGETCDTALSPTCPADCTTEVCGDGDLEGGEIRDDGNAVNSDNCPNDCSPAVCNDGVVEGGETCEPPGAVGCDAECHSVPVCGNSIEEAGEECDPPAAGVCDAACQDIVVGPAVCGNGTVEAGEECEGPQSGNCDSNCQELTAASCLACESANPDISPYVTPDHICNFYAAGDVATEGPAAGTSRSDLCWEMAECIRATECAENGAIKCYCGSSGDCSTPNGDCKAVVERSLEATSFGSIAVRFGDFTYGGAGALTLGNLDADNCKSACFTDPTKPLAQ